MPFFFFLLQLLFPFALCGGSLERPTIQNLGSVEWLNSDRQDEERSLLFPNEGNTLERIKQGSFPSSQYSARLVAEAGNAVRSLSESVSHHHLTFISFVHSFRKSVDLFLPFSSSLSLIGTSLSISLFLSFRLFAHCHFLPIHWTFQPSSLSFSCLLFPLFSFASSAPGQVCPFHQHQFQYWPLPLVVPCDYSWESWLENPLVSSSYCPTGLSVPLSFSLSLFLSCSLALSFGVVCVWLMMEATYESHCRRDVRWPPFSATECHPVIEWTNSKTSGIFLLLGSFSVPLWDTQTESQSHQFDLCVCICDCVYVCDSQGKNWAILLFFPVQATGTPESTRKQENTEGERG